MKEKHDQGALNTQSCCSLRFKLSLLLFPEDATHMYRKQCPQSPKNFNVTTPSGLSLLHKCFRCPWDKQCSVQLRYLVTPCFLEFGSCKTAATMSKPCSCLLTSDSIAPRCVVRVGQALTASTERGGFSQHLNRCSQRMLLSALGGGTEGKGKDFAKENTTRVNNHALIQTRLF